MDTVFKPFDTQNLLQKQPNTLGLNPRMKSAMKSPSKSLNKYDYEQLNKKVIKQVSLHNQQVRAYKQKVKRMKI